jgi:hypothetical protein
MHLADVRPLGCGDAGAGRLSREAENTEPHCTGEYEVSMAGRIRVNLAHGQKLAQDLPSI